MRSVAIHSEAEFRSTPTGHHFTGYAAVFDSPSEPLGPRGIIEIIKPDAFARDLKRPNRRTLVVDHDDTRLLASTASGHLVVSTDTRGLITDADLPDTQLARDVRELHERGETSGMSFEFSPNGKDGAVYSTDGKTRELRDVRTYHYTILQGLTPAFSATSAEIRGLAAAVEADPDDVAEVIDAINEQRRLSESELPLLERLLAAIRPEVPEVRAAAPVLTPNLEAARELLAAR